MTSLKIGLALLALPLLVPHTVPTAIAAVWLIRRVLFNPQKGNHYGFSRLVG